MGPGRPGLPARLGRARSLVRDADMGQQLAGGRSSWCPELESRATHRPRHQRTTHSRWPVPRPAFQVAQCDATAKCCSTRSEGGALEHCQPTIRFSTQTAAGSAQRHARKDRARSFRRNGSHLATMNARGECATEEMICRWIGQGSSLWCRATRQAGGGGSGQRTVTVVRDDGRNHMADSRLDRTRLSLQLQ